MKRGLNWCCLPILGWLRGWLAGKPIWASHFANGIATASFASPSFGIHMIYQGTGRAQESSEGFGVIEDQGFSSFFFATFDDFPALWSGPTTRLCYGTLKNHQIFRQNIGGREKLRISMIVDLSVTLGHFSGLISGTTRLKPNFLGTDTSLPR